MEGWTVASLRTVKMENIMETVLRPVCLNTLLYQTPFCTVIN